MTSDLLAGVHPSWLTAFDRVSPVLTDIGELIETERETGHAIAPDLADIFRAFRQPLDSIRVVIVGQDPYPTPGHAVGLAFSTARDVRPIPRSLANIFRELHDDLGIEPSSHGDLSHWAAQGVLLLNTALTVRVGSAGSHRDWPWKDITSAALQALADRGDPLVAILWGRDAQWSRPFLPGVATVQSAHPSPLSAHRGFFGSRPFSRTNASLSAQGSSPIDWQV
ncbi:MAG: uracil-DNA glycosylase [Microbacteriaceae bacterium]|nr:uracil-DNA glycosylase [Microbacteriaceae bacterium]